MRRLIAYFILSKVKIISMLFYRAKYGWLTPIPGNDWKKIRMMVLLNHTSLYEPLYLQILPFSYLWHLSAHLNVPGADVTLDRPIVGTFWKLMVPNISSITRKKDSTWQNYLDSIKPDDVIIIAPEGRMKRPNGLDRHGKKMTVRGGIADIIDSMDEGGILLCLSGGLHHVQAPGQHFPRLFKTIHMNFRYLDIKDFKAQFPGSSRERKFNMIQTLQQHLENDCPQRDIE